MTGAGTTTTRDARPGAGGLDPRARADVRRTGVAALACLLGSVTLKGLLTDSGWLVDVALTIVVVTAPAALIRLRRAPSALDVWPGVVLMIPWLTARFVGADAIGGFIPRGRTLHQVSLLMGQLHDTMHSGVAPIHSTTAIRLVLCALIGLLAALVDLIAIVGRRGALAGIPLLVVYTVSGAVPRHPVSWVWFLCAAVGFLLLLSLDATDDRARWGHRIADPHGSRVRTVVTRTAPRLGVVALALAVVVPLVIPVGSSNVLADAFHHHTSETGGFGARSDTGGSINPFAALHAQLDRGTPENMATVHIDGSPSSDPFYLRVNVLDVYSDAGWSAGDHGQVEAIERSHLQVEPAENDPPATSFHARITIDGLTGNAPIFTTLTAVSGVEEGSLWSPQDQVIVGGNVHRGQQIQLEVRQPEPSPAQLAKAGSNGRLAPDLSHWLAKPALPSYVVQLVARLTSKLTSPYAKARALNSYFTDPANGFVYSLSTPTGDSGSALVDFLKGHEGFCQQYAAAMAIMLRQAGVPSRVVLGYMHSPPDKQSNFTVTTNDAHAWVEAYFDGIGWIPFDPTPVAGLTGGRSSDLAWAPHDFSSGSSSVGPARPSANPTPRPTGPTSSAPSVAAVAPAGSGGGGPGAFGWLVAAAVVALLLLFALVPAWVRADRRRRRMAAARNGDADALWTELADTVTDLGYAWSPTRSPRQVAAWLGPDLERARPGLDAMMVDVERARFGRDARLRTGPAAAQDLAAVSAELRARRSGRTRVGSLLWPRSLGWRVSRVRTMGRVRMGQLRSA